MNSIGAVLSSQKNKLRISRMVLNDLHNNGYNTSNVDKLVDDAVRAYVRQNANQSPLAVVSRDFLEVIDYHNSKIFHNIVSQYSPLTDSITQIMGGIKPRDQFMPEDYRQLDVWQESPVFVNSNFKNNNRGLNNPHVIGAHKRHVERAGDGLYNLELVNESYGFDMKDAYNTSMYK